MSTGPSPVRISSLQNSRVKDTIKLNKRGERDRLRQTVVEGERETLRALDAGIQPIAAFLCAEILGPRFDAVLARLLGSGTHPHQIFDTTPPVFAKLAYRGESGGIVLVVPYFSRTLESLVLPANAITLAIEGVEKPGNLGAILRTADATGVHAVIVTDGATDIHNPNTIRAALGASFTVPVAQADRAATAHFMRTKGIHTVATTPDAPSLFWDAQLTGPVAILMGSEAHGLSEFWLEQADERVRVPMHGAMDSLNLSTATAVMLYEVLRQRQDAS